MLCARSMSSPRTYREKLQARITATGSRLCVGLDPRPEAHGGDLRGFLAEVIEQTLPWAAAYKPNCAYFEALGSRGLAILEELRGLIPADVPLVLDAKRGDIGETQKYYAKAAFEVLGADAVTLNPFMGFDTLEPFLSEAGKGVYLLAVTSNPGSADIERQILADGRPVFALVEEFAARAHGSPATVGFVVGLTNAASDVLGRFGDHPLLIPGLGAQGGDLALWGAAARPAPDIINVSRGILYAEPEKSFAEKARDYAHSIALHHR